MTYETIKVEPLSPVIGAEISGVDLRRPLGNQTFDEINRATFTMAWITSPQAAGLCGMEPSRLQRVRQG